MRFINKIIETIEKNKQTIYNMYYVRKVDLKCMKNLKKKEK